MILDIPALASGLVPELAGQSADLAAICIRTTNPKYLLFKDDSEFPICVAQVGSRPELTRTDLVLARIHAQAPDLVARPLGILPLGGDRCVHLQSGMRGLPWFVIQDRARTREHWRTIVAAAANALGRLQSAIAAYPDWNVRLQPGDELRKQVELCASRGTELSTRATRFIEQQAIALDTLGEITSQYQHGDFCLNNLLIADTHAAVIDFDEFGRTAMPLHDEIGLGISIADLASFPELAPPLRHEHLQGLFLHHLLWRINQAWGWPTRQRNRDELLAKVEARASAPTR